MEDFFNKLVSAYQKAGEIAKGTAANMKRGLDGTAMEDMRRFEEERNAKLIDKAYPGGMPQYARDNGMMDAATSTPAAPQGNYLGMLRALLNKP